jgi:hypothetical protein
MNQCCDITPLRSQAHWQVAQKANARPKPAKELANPIARVACGIKHENTTINIGHLADSAKFEMSTINKIYSGLTSWSFEMPNAPYSSRCRQ